MAAGGECKTYKIKLPIEVTANKTKLEDVKTSELLNLVKQSLTDLQKKFEATDKMSNGKLVEVQIENQHIHLVFLFTTMTDLESFQQYAEQRHGEKKSNNLSKFLTSFFKEMGFGRKLGLAQRLHVKATFKEYTAVVSYGRDGPLDDDDDTQSSESGSSDSTENDQYQDSFDGFNKRIILYMPKGVEKVTVRCSTFAEIDKQPMTLNGSLWTWYRVIPEYALEQKHLIYLEYTKKAVIFKKTKIIENIHIPLDKAPFVRVLVGESSPEAVLEHLYDIYGMSALSKASFQQCVTQIENLCSAYVSPRPAIEIVQGVISFDAKNNPDINVLKLVSVGVIQEKCPGLLSRVTFDKQFIRSFLDDVSKTYSVSDFPETCARYLPLVSVRLCQQEFKADMCIVLFLFHCRTFLGDRFSLKFFTDELLAELRLKWICDSHSCMKCCETLYQSFIKEERLHPLLQELLNALSLSPILKIIEGLRGQTEMELNKHAICLEIAKGKLRKGAEESVDTLPKFLKFLRSVEQVPSLSTEAGFLVKKMVLCIQKQISVDAVSSKDLLEVCKTHWFCSKAQHRKEILDALKTSPDKNLRTVFMELNFNSDFCKEPTKCSEDTACIMLKKTIKEMGRVAASDLPHLYPKICSIKKSCLTEEAEFKVDAIVREHLRGIDIKEILKQSDSIARRGKTEEDLFSRHVCSLIIDKYGSSLEDAFSLLSVDGEGRLVMQNSVLASVAEAIVNSIDLGDESQVITVLQRICKRSLLWRPIFASHGKFAARLKDNKIVKRAQTCIDTLLENLLQGKLTCSDVAHISKTVDRSALLECLSYREKSLTEVEERWQNVVDEIDKITKQTTVVVNVLEVLKSKLKGNAPVDQALTAAYTVKSSIEEKVSFTFAELEDIMHDFVSFPAIHKECFLLEKYVDSVMFWNAQVQEDEKQCLSLNEFEQFLSSFTTKCVRRYELSWRNLQENESMSFDTVRSLLSHANIKEEISHAKQLNISIQQDTEKILLRLECISEYVEKVQIMVKGVEAMGMEMSTDDAFMKAFSCIKCISQDSGNKLMFFDVKLSMNTICDLADTLSEDDFSVLEVLATSSSLIAFLKELMDEDLRNLIDTLEDVSEQQMQESTISGFIELQQFMQPLLTFSSENKEDYKTVMEIVSNQVKKSPKGIPQKLTDCNQNLHNFKAMYNNLTNKSQVTKTHIENILRNGSFNFKIESGECQFSVCYIHEEKEYKHAMSTLIDIRGRALLLMNPEIANENTKLEKEDLLKFVEYIDLCTDIAQSVDDLHAHGHRDYKSFEEETDLNRLNKLNLKISSDLKEWLAVLTESRKRNYLLNFVHGEQLTMLVDCIQKGKCTEEVADMLKFINPQLEVDLSHGGFASSISLKDNTQMEFLESLGEVLNEHVSRVKPFERFFELENVPSSSLVHSVQNGRLFLAELQKDSTLVTNLVIALYFQTSSKLPEASQIIFCTRFTTWTEIQLLINRCLGFFQRHKRLQLHCIANVELLSSQLQFKLLSVLKDLPREGEFLLAVICRGSDSHPFLNALSSFRGKIPCLPDGTLKSLFTSICPNVTTLTSQVAGLGKSCYIFNLGRQTQRPVKTLHISGPIRKKALIDRLKALQLTKGHILHIDIGDVDNYEEVDTFLFELIILRHVAFGTTSVHVKTEHVCIEIANTISKTLQNKLHTALSFREVTLWWKNYDDFIGSYEINAPVQVVCHYLKCLDENELDKKDLQFSGPNAIKPLRLQICRKILRSVFPSSEEMSFTLVHVFLNFFSDQLKKLSCSSFFKRRTLSDMVGRDNVSAIKSTLVLKLLSISVEFASRSVKACKVLQDSSMAEAKPKATAAELAVESVAGMIRWEDNNHLMFVFHNQDVQTLSAVYRNLAMVSEDVKSFFEGQMGKKSGLPDYSSMDQEALQKQLQHVARTDPSPLEREKLLELSNGYALTPDNFLKMVLIMLRVKASIPVVVMGETGCGKTSLVRYLAEICGALFQVLSIHSGVREKTILDSVDKANAAALVNLDNQIWLFLDEINTSDHLGLISDVVCHHSCLGKKLSPNLVIMAACNPYKLRSGKHSLSSGLQEKIKSDELSKLVYRVHPLPESMIDFVWDFGTLNAKDEASYIKRMSDGVFETKQHHDMFSELIEASQRFVREEEKMTSCVSLRDVRRCCTLAKWFHNILKVKPLKKQRPDTMHIEREIVAMILALAHCYQSRFQENSTRKEYRERLAIILRNHSKPYEERDIRSSILCQQNDLLDRMELPPGTAKNSALQENVFVIIGCILNKIPIFLVGKPGCSKSLSMQIIKNNLRGKDSKDDFFKTLPQLYCVSFQASESSTSDGIIKVFDRAEKYQEASSADDVLSVVILDELGLAEVSRFNPLKVLHSLLEPTEGDGPNVAVVGISNWSLDSSKMNRAVHLSRPEMDEEELYETGKSISTSLVDALECDIHSSSPLRVSQGETVYDQLTDQQLKEIATSYYQYVNRQNFKHFHGLRDYYALIKFVARKIVEQGKRLSNDQKHSALLQGLQRNFGGLPNEKQILFDSFHLIPAKEEAQLISLVKENIKDPEARHLMLITTGDGIMCVVEDLLKSLGREKTTIYGSQFEEDQHDDYSYSILSKIILCMEQGIVVVLKDLENIYGSLYDMLNQNYTVVGKKKNCKIALGPNSNSVCQVHDDFRCIVLTQENNLPFSDPPFLNRFEKQYLTFRDVLSPEENQVITALSDWLDLLTDIEGKDFIREDVIPICSCDLLPSLVLKYAKGLDFPMALSLCKAEMVWIIQPEAVMRLPRSAMESRDAEQFREMYFNLPVHQGLEGFLKVNTNSLTIIFTNSSIHTPMAIAKDENQIEQIGTFKSEKQLFVRIEHFWKESSAIRLIIQCRAADDSKHILLAKSIVEKLRNECLKTHPKKQSVLIVHLGREKVGFTQVPQINFLSDWKLVTLDSLLPPTTPLPDLDRNLHTVINQRSPFNEYFCKQLFWAITRIRYTGRTVEDLQNLLSKLQSSAKFLNAVHIIVDRFLEKRVLVTNEEDWRQVVACDNHALSTYSSFTGALDEHIFHQIKILLAMSIFQLEKTMALETLFICSKSDAKATAWMNMAADQTLFDVDEIKEPTGPECYVCTESALSLQMPFSKVFYDRVESTKDEFISAMGEMILWCDVEAVEDLPEENRLDLVSKHKSFVTKSVHRQNNYIYTGWQEDYLSDYCNISSSILVQDLEENHRIEALKWAMKTKLPILGTDPEDVLVNIHTVYWMNSGLFNSILSLFETLGDEITKDYLQLLLTPTKGEEEEEEKEEEEEENTATYSAFDDFISSVCLSMLPTQSTIENFKGIQNWHFRANKVLALASLVSVLPESLHSLRLCNDIVALMEDMKTAQSTVIELASLIKSNCVGGIGSEKIFRLIHSLTEAASKDEKLQIWRLYFKRCSGAETTSCAINYLIQLICDNAFDEKDFLGFWSVIEDSLRSMKDECYALLKAETKHSSGSQETFNFKALFQAYSNKQAHIKPLTVLVIDVLESNFMDDLDDDDVFTQERNDAIDLLQSADNALRDTDFGSRQAVAIAYLKAFLGKFTQGFGKRLTEQRNKYNVTCETLKAVMNRERADANHEALRDFFFKTLMRHRRMSSIVLIKETLGNIAEFFDDICLNEDYKYRGFECAPLTVMFPGTAKLLGENLDFAAESQLKGTLKAITKLSLDSSDGMGDLLAFAQCAFYLHRSVEPLSIAFKRLGDLLVNEAVEQNLPVACSKFLECLIGTGKTQFNDTQMVLNTETDNKVVTISGFITSLLSVTLAHNQRHDRELSVFGRYLYGKTDLAEKGLPFSNFSFEEHFITFRVERYECCNSVSVMAHSDNENCPKCKKELKKGSRDHHLKRHSSATLVKRVFELFTSFISLGALALGFISEPQVSQQVDWEDSTRKELHNADNLRHLIVRNFEDLQSCLGLGHCELGLLLHALLKRFTENTLLSSTYTSASDREQWENGFSEIVSHVFATRLQEMHDYLNEHCSVQKVDISSWEMRRFELPNKEENEKSTKTFFRVKGIGSVNGMLTEMMLSKSDETFPFLNLILSQRDEIGLLVHAYPLLKWHQTVVSFANYSLLQGEYERMTIEQFIEERVNKRERKKLLFDIFGKFTEAWKEIQKVLKTNRKLFSDAPPPYFSLRSRMQDTLLADEVSITRKVFEYLVDTQNDVIEKSMTISVTGNCRNLGFLRSSKYGSETLCVSSVTKESFINLSWTEDDYISFAHADLEVGKGRNVVYDFDAMEKDLAYDILRNKPMIGKSSVIPVLTFKDELFKNFAKIANEVKTLVPQIPLTEEIKGHLNKEKTIRPKEMYELLTQLEVIMLLLLRTKPIESEALVNFIDRFSFFFGGRFPTEILPHPESSIKINHIISLHEHVEELDADGMIRGLKEKFRKAIGSDQIQPLEMICSSSTEVTKHLLQSVKRFIHRCMWQEDFPEKQKLSCYLQDPSFWTDGILCDGEIAIGKTFRKPILDLIPDALLVEHTYELAEFLENTIKSQEDKAQRDAIASTISTDIKAKSKIKAKRKRTQKT